MQHRHMKEINLCVYACMHAVYVCHASGVPHNYEATPMHTNLCGNGFHVPYNNYTTEVIYIAQSLHNTIYVTA